MKRLPILILLILSGLGLACGGRVPLEKQSSDVLLGRADGYIEADTILDRAVAALTEVTNRYYRNTDDKTARRNAVEAMIRLGKVYSYRLFDFPKAYHALSTARMIAQDDGDEYNLAEVLVLLGNVNIVTAEPDDAERQAMIDSLLAESLVHAIAGRNEEVIARHAVNSSIRQIKKTGWGPYSTDMKRIAGYHFRDKRLGDISRNVIRGMDAYFGKDYDKAESILKLTLDSVPLETYKERYVYGLMYLLQYVYEMKGDYATEEKAIRSRLELANQLGLHDYRLFTYAHLYNFFNRREQPDSARKYLVEYLLLENELKESSGLNKVGNLEMLRQVERTNEEVRELSVQKQRSRRHLVIAIAIIAVVVVICGGFAYLSVRLRRNNRTLFTHNRELLDLQEQYRRIINAEEKETQDPQNPQEVVPPGEELTQLYGKIVKFMETSKEIYSSGFSIDDLAGHLHVTQRSVSRAINSCAGQNFHTFLNGYRIRETCRLMQTADRNFHTVESIAEKAGFRSRTSFATLFKKTTGLTPSDYREMARKNPQTTEE